MISTPWTAAHGVGNGAAPHAAGDFAHRDPSDDQGVCDERAMAAPRNGLGAHQRDMRVVREIDTPIQISSERRGLHESAYPGSPYFATHFFDEFRRGRRNPPKPGICV